MRDFDADNERTERSLFGLTFRATTREYRDLWKRLSDTKTSLEWGRMRNIVALYVFRGRDDYAEQIATDMNRLERAMETEAGKLIDQLEASREIPDGM